MIKTFTWESLLCRILTCISGAVVVFAHLFLNEYFFVPPEYPSWSQQQAEAPRRHRAVWRDVIHSA